MGNKLGRKRHALDDRYTKPQGQYSHKDVDHKKLRKLILEFKLAPCYPGEDDPLGEYEDCLICFMYYPSLNRSRCCMKGICTECFLQMKNPNSTRPTLCPFCKTSNYAVEYRGQKSKEEKMLEQIEEQRVIEAKIRMRLEQEEEIEIPASENSMLTEEAGCSSSTYSGPSPKPLSNEEVISLNRDEGHDVDLEDVMLMEAIWRSTQTENAKPGNAENNDGCESTSPVGGLACTIAALAERQHAAAHHTSTLHS